MRLFKTEAIVLSTRDHAESDRLVEFHTACCGRLRGIAKGARRSKKRFVNAFEPGNLVQLECREKNSFHWIESCNLVNPYLLMRTDMEKWAYSALLTEIVSEMIPEGESQPNIFLLHKETLGRLEKDKDPLNVVLLALLRLQLLTGYMPALDGCFVCRRMLKTAPGWYWQASRGKLVCPDHFSPGEHYTPLDLGTLTLINYSRKIPLDKIWRLRIRQEIKMALFMSLLDWIRCHTGREIRSLKVLQQILPPEEAKAPAVITGDGAGDSTSVKRLIAPGGMY